jgi:arylformamidase
MFTIVDLTRPLTSQSLSYPGDQIGVAVAGAGGADPETQATRPTLLDMHLGTHMDAPLHFIPGAADIASLALVLRPAVVVRTRERAIPARALPEALPQGCAVLFDTGWTTSLESRSYYEGFPHLSPELAEALVSRGATLVAIDTPSVDAIDPTSRFPAHRILLGAGIPIVEGLCNLDRLPDGARAFWFAAFPLKLEGADGSPVRAVALLPAQDAAGHRR